MKKADVVQIVLQEKISSTPQQDQAEAFASTNIALCKYWGKRDGELNLPMTSSLSISLPEKGAKTKVFLHDKNRDTVILNGKEIAADEKFVQRLSEFLDLFRPHKNWFLRVEINMNLPVAAGLASSACGFAALVLALNDLFKWRLNEPRLSVLARLGSGSACRSLWKGFVEWQVGVRDDGMDSYAQSLPVEWPEFRVGIVTINNQPKAISSREAMQRTVDSSVLYSAWPKKVVQDLSILKQALHVKSFALLGGVAESNALSMHATMLGSWPPVCYFLPETVAAMHKVWDLRREGLGLFFTEDAGPNLKLLFLEKDEAEVKNHFPTLDVMKVF